MSSTPTSVAGACLCGTVRFTVTLPSKWCAHCHCSMCRRAHGAPYVTWLGVERSQLHIESGEDQLGRHRSSPAASRSFCRHCGSPLFFESARWAQEVHIARAAIEAEIDRLPQAHVFFSDKAAWLDLHREATVPKRGGASGTEPL